MTISANDRRKEYAGNGTTTQFTGPRAFSASHIAVYEVDDATQVATLQTGYTLANVGVRNRQTVVTMPAPVATGKTLLILRTVSYEQGTNITNQGAYLPQVVEDALDNLEQQLQQVAEGVARSFRAPDTATAVDAIGNTPNRYVVTDADGRPALADDPPAADLTLRGDLASAASGKGAEQVAFVQAGTGAGTRSLQDKARDHVSVEDFTVAADGVTDDAAEISNAVTRAVARGVPLNFDGTKSYALGTLVTIPAGARIRTNGCTFIDKSGAGTGNSLLLDFGAGVELDSLKITVPAAIGRQRCVRFTGANNRIGDIAITYTDQQTGDDVTDSAVRFTNCTNLTVGMVTVAKHDRAVTFESCTGVTARGVDISSYLRGMYILDTKDCHIGRSRLLTASPFASITAGHVGVLLESASTDATRNVTLEDFHIENAGEHGIRIAGPEQLSNIRIVRPAIKSVGASGIKILGTDTGTPTSRSKRIYIIDPIIEDVGTANSNRCGILAQFCDEVYITHPMIRKQAGANSAHTGIRLTSCTNVHIVHPHCMDAVNFGIWLDGTEGDIDQVLITGGMVRANGDVGLRIATGAVVTFRRIHVSDLLCSSNTNLGASFGVGAGTAIDCEMKLQVAGSTSAIACDTAAVYLDGSGAVGAGPLAGVTARNGSRWSDGVTLNIRKAGAWSAL